MKRSWAKNALGTEKSITTPFLAGIAAIPISWLRI